MQVFLVGLGMGGYVWGAPFHPIYLPMGTQINRGGGCIIPVITSHNNNCGDTAKGVGLWGVLVCLHCIIALLFYTLNIPIIVLFL